MVRPVRNHLHGRVATRALSVNGGEEYSLVTFHGTGFGCGMVVRIHLNVTAYVSF